MIFLCPERLGDFGFNAKPLRLVASGEDPGLYKSSETIGYSKFLKGRCVIFYLPKPYEHH